jgi:hypothetical protein
VASHSGLLVVSGVETLAESPGVIDRVQLCEFFDASNDLRAKRALPMRFALIERSGSAELADAVGFVPVAFTETTTVVNAWSAPVRT